MSRTVYYLILLRRMKILLLMIIVVMININPLRKVFTCETYIERTVDLTFILFP